MAEAQAKERARRNEASKQAVTLRPAQTKKSAGGMFQAVSAKDAEWNAIQNEAIKLYNDGENERGFERHKEAIKAAEKAYGSNHSKVATVNENLALFYSLKGYYTQAEELYKRALKMREKVQGADNIDVARSLENFADNYTRKKEYANAEELLKRALKIREKKQGPDHIDVAATLNNLGNAYVSLEKYEQAESMTVDPIY